MTDKWDMNLLVQEERGGRWKYLGTVLNQMAREREARYWMSETNFQRHFNKRKNPIYNRKKGKYE